MQTDLQASHAVFHGGKECACEFFDWSIMFELSFISSAFALGWMIVAWGMMVTVKTAAEKIKIIMTIWNNKYDYDKWVETDGAYEICLL